MIYPYFASKKLEEAKSFEYAKQISDENPESVEALDGEMDFDEFNEVNASGGPDNCTVEDSVFKWPHEAILMLIEEYRTNENNFTTGKISQKKLWKNLMDDLLGAKPNITPTATCSSTGKRTRSNSTCSSVSSENELDETATIVKKSKYKQPIDKLLDVLEERSSIQEANKDRRFRELLAFKERKMEENLELKKRAVELLAQIVNRQQQF
ncbi:hypothetical protein KQX54_014220 [Cotesia glomerata]|uniref:Uncharacterized protein n=2 Tax=Cotesia glomerata TaxID=32391 RepID=A0AAV7I932_COTGL|nr:hypothetical protein KQX54_014220 [Cotesia glomerata]